jgi:hypothetical protein
MEAAEAPAALPPDDADSLASTPSASDNESSPALPFSMAAIVERCRIKTARREARARRHRERVEQAAARARKSRARWRVLRIAAMFIARCMRTRSAKEWVNLPQPRAGMKELLAALELPFGVRGPAVRVAASCASIERNYWYYWESCRAARHRCCPLLALQERRLVLDFLASVEYFRRLKVGPAQLEQLAADADFRRVSLEGFPLFKEGHPGAPSLRPVASCCARDSWCVRVDLFVR